VGFKKFGIITDLTVMERATYNNNPCCLVIAKISNATECDVRIILIAVMRTDLCDNPLIYLTCIRGY
jgi:hypothetical protein